MSTSFTDVSTLHLVRLFAKINVVSAFPCIRLGGALLLSAALVACGQSADTPEAAEPAVVVSPNDDRAYDLIELANGLEVMLVSDPTVEKSAAIRFVVSASNCFTYCWRLKAYAGEEIAAAAPAEITPRRDKLGVAMPTMSALKTSAATIWLGDARDRGGVVSST